MTQTLHIPVPSNTHSHRSCVECVSSSFAKLRAIKYFLPMELNSLNHLRFSPNSDCICTESNLHVFCSTRYTGSASISIETSVKSKIRIHSAHRDFATKCARDVSHTQTASSVRALLQYLLSIRRMGHGSSIT